MEDVMRIRATTLFLALAFGATVSGCGSDGAATSALVAQVIPVEAVKVITDAPTLPFEGAQVIKFTVSGPGMSDVSTSYDFTAGGGDLPAFPEGYERQLTVEVCRNTCDVAAGNDIISRGRSVPLTVFKGDTRTATVFVATRNAFVPPSVIGENGTEPSVITNKYRVGATVTTLDDGRILIAGGAKIKTSATGWNRAEDLESVTADAEIFDPRTGTYTAVSAMNMPRAHHVAVKLGGPNRADRRVVLMGGFTTGGEITSTVELFDPDTNAFVQEPQDRSLAGAGRALFTAALAYPDQNVVFLAGGIANPSGASGSWQLYMVGAGTVAAGALTPGPTGDQSATGTARWNQTMTFVPAFGKDADGKDAGAFLLLGGENNDGTVDIAEAYLVDPLNGGQFSIRRDESATTTMPLGGRTGHSAVYVARQGIVYVVGGFLQKGQSGPIDRIEVYRQGAKGFHKNDEGAFDEYLPMAGARGGTTATLLDPTTIFIAGGFSDSGPTSRTEVIVETVECQDANGTPPCYRVPRLFTGRTPDMDAPRAGQTAVLDSTRRLFLLGGVGDTNVTPDPILYNPE
jgi:hypothetical protein